MKIIQRVKEILKDIEMSPKSVKILIGIMVMALIISSMAACSGFGYGPSREFVSKVMVRSELHLPRYKLLIYESSPAMIEKMLGQAPGALKDASPEDIAFLKQSLIAEVDAYLKFVRRNYGLINERGEKK